MAYGRARFDTGGPSLDGSIIIAFALIVIASAAAFVWVADVQDRVAVSSVRVYQAPTDMAQGGADEAEVDPVTTSAVTPSAKKPVETAAALCDIDACAAAYRSFRVADCTFQPFDGPRRLCTR